MAQHSDAANRSDISRDNYVSHEPNHDSTFGSILQYDDNFLSVNHRGMLTALKSVNDFSAMEISVEGYHLIFSNYGDFWFKNTTTDTTVISGIPYKGHIVIVSKHNNLVLLYNPEEGTHKVFTNHIFEDYIHIELFVNMQFYPLTARKKTNIIESNVSSIPEIGEIVYCHANLIGSHYPMPVNCYMFNMSERLSVRPTAYLKYLYSQYPGTFNPSEVTGKCTTEDYYKYRYYDFISGLKAWMGYAEGLLENSLPNALSYSDEFTNVYADDSGISFSCKDYNIPFVCYQTGEMMRTYRMRSIQTKKITLLHHNGTLYNGSALIQSDGAPRKVEIKDGILEVPNDVFVIMIPPSLLDGETKITAEQLSLSSRFICKKSDMVEKSVEVYPKFDDYEITTNGVVSSIKNGLVTFLFRANSNYNFKISKPGYTSATDRDLKDGHITLKKIVEDLEIVMSGKFTVFISLNEDMIDSTSVDAEDLVSIPLVPGTYYVEVKGYKQVNLGRLQMDKYKFHINLNG